MTLISNSKRSFIALAIALYLALINTSAAGTEVKAAVAANFTTAIKRLTPLYEKKTGNKLIASFGSTGQLYAQIHNGAPFDVFLAADTRRPKKLVTEGVAAPASYFVYARGQLALWSSRKGYVDAKGTILHTNKFDKIAIANPQTAPYGAAAIATLSHLDLLGHLRPKFVIGESVAQTQQFIASGNVPLGFIALAQVKALPAADRGSWWIVPAALHKPIDQAAVRLKLGNAQAADSFLAFLQSPEAIAVIRKLGYDVPRH